MKNDSSSFRNDTSGPGPRNHHDDHPCHHHDNDDEDLKSVQFFIHEEQSLASSATSCTWSDAQVRNALNTTQSKTRIQKKKMSPATQTLHQLSQTVDQLDLLCGDNSHAAVVDSPLRHNACPPEFSQYEFSVAAILATAKETKRNDYDDDDDTDHLETELLLHLDDDEVEKEKEEKSLALVTIPASEKAKTGRRRRHGNTTKDSKKRKTVVKKSKPSRVKHTTKTAAKTATTTTKNPSSRRKDPAPPKTSKQRSTTTTAPPSSTLPHTHAPGSYRSQAVEKWRGNHLVQVFQSMRQAAEAVGTHHGHIKRLVQTGDIHNGFVWKLQKQQKKVAPIIPKKTAIKANQVVEEEGKPKAKQKEASRATKNKEETPLLRRATRRTTPLGSAPSSSVKVPIQKANNPAKHPSPAVHYRSKSVQRINPDGSVARTFPSMLQASVITGIARRCIRDCLNDTTIKDKNGFGWRLMETADTPPSVKSTKDSKTASKDMPSMNGTKGSKTASKEIDRIDRAFEEKEAKSAFTETIGLPCEETNVTASSDKQFPPVAPVKLENKSKAIDARDSEGPQFHVSFAEISSAGKLGLMIRSIPLPDEARAAVAKSTSIKVLAFTKGCTVENVKSGSLCEKVGIRSGDSLFLVQEMEGRPCLNGNYDMILEAARSDQRPIKFCKIRPIVKKLTYIPQSNVILTKAQRRVEPTLKELSSKSPPNVELANAQASKDSIARKLSSKPQSNDERTKGPRNSEPTVKKLPPKPQPGVEQPKTQAKFEHTVKKFSSKMQPGTEQPKTQAKVGPTEKKLSSKMQPGVEQPKTQAMMKHLGIKLEVDSIAPYCVLCSGGATKHQVHHAWCQRNPQFKKSGAHEVLRRITEGIKLNCDVCEMEFRTGRIQLNSVHNAPCKENQKVIFDVEDLPQPVTVKAKAKRQEKQPCSSQPTEATGKKQNANEPALKKKRGRSVKVSAKILNSEADLSDIGRAGSDASEELEPLRKRRSVSSLFRADRSPDPKKVANKTNSLNNKKTAPQNQGDSANVPRSQPNVSSNNVDVDTSKKRVNQQYASFAADYSSESDAEYDGSGELEITWEPCPNPWGEKGFVDGDVVIFSKQAGIGNVETALPSPRFAFDPLSASCRYKKTHHMPNEGFHALLLQRDPKRILSWGFSVKRHEFGGACLVSSVEPMSPAQAAVFVGAHNEDQSYAALRMNDMIMTVDGKEVGGMTVESFNLALDLAGSELILVVSRYKCLAQESVAQEAQLLSEVDKHINDPSRLDWTDIGGGSTSAFHKYRKNEQTGPLYQPTPETHVSVHSKSSPKYTSIANQEENRNLPLPESDGSKEEPDSSSPKKPSEAPSIKQVQSFAEHQDGSIHQHEEASENISLLSSVEPTDLRSVLEADEESSNSDEFGEDGNAWCGCVCGNEHKTKGNYFWIQCEACCSWFNVYERCVGFGKKEAESMEEWTCWACEEDNSLKLCDNAEKKSESSKQKLTEQIGEKASTIASRDKAVAQQTRETLKQDRMDLVSQKALSDERTDSIDSADHGEVASQQQQLFHKVGSLVFIQEHAWSGVNNPEGVARVTGTHVDEEDGRTYDVKYIVGRSSKGVFARYVTPHNFD